MAFTSGIGEVGRGSCGGKIAGVRYYRLKWIGESVLDIAALVVSIVALFGSWWTWRKSHQFETKRLEREEHWRLDDIARDFEAHQPHIEIEQFLRAGGPPDLPNEGMYLVVIAKNTGRVSVTLVSEAHFALTPLEAEIDSTDLSRPSIYSSKRDHPDWFSREKLPLKLEPNESCTSFIDLDYITEFANVMNLAMRPEDQYKACIGFYEDTLGRFYKPDYVVQFVPD